MRCYICDNELSENEIQVGPEGKSEPCTTCMTVIMDTAYSDGFAPRDEETGDTGVPVLEEDDA